MTQKRVLLIRHGQTDWNAQHRWQGIEPTPLNELGFTQARMLAEYLARHKEPIEEIHCSDLPRALQTATIIGEALDVTPQIDIRWREINVGVFQGLTGQEAERLYEAEMAAYRSDDIHFVIPNGESRHALQKRAYEVWLEIIKEEDSPTEIAIVSHGGTIKALLRELFGMNDERLKPFLPNTSITTLQCSKDKWELISLGQTPHLPPDMRDI
jgi:broad specificity phosphatase PhoE